MTLPVNDKLNITPFKLTGPWAILSFGVSAEDCFDSDRFHHICQDFVIYSLCIARRKTHTRESNKLRTLLLSVHRI